QDHVDMHLFNRAREGKSLTAMKMFYMRMKDIEKSYANKQNVFAAFQEEMKQTAREMNRLETRLFYSEDRDPDFNALKESQEALILAAFGTDSASSETTSK